MKKLSIALILALALALPGCSMLREDASPAQEDRLVASTSLRSMWTPSTSRHISRTTPPAS